MRCLFVMALALLLPACSDAPVPMATNEADVQGKSFSPLPDRGVIYFYRESKFASALSVSVLVGRDTPGALASGTWFRVDLEPGQYLIRCSVFESRPNSDPKIIQLAADEIHFVEIGFNQGRCAVLETPPEKGRTAVLASRRAAVLMRPRVAEHPEFTTHVVVPPVVAKPVVATPAGPISIIYRDDVTNERTLKGVARYDALLGRDHLVPFTVENERAEKTCDGTFTKEGPNNGKFTLSCVGGVSANGSFERKPGDRNDSFIARGQTSRGFPITLVIGRPAGT